MGRFPWRGGDYVWQEPDTGPRARVRDGRTPAGGYLWLVGGPSTATSSRSLFQRVWANRQVYGRGAAAFVVGRHAAGYSWELITYRAAGRAGLAGWADTRDSEWCVHRRRGRVRRHLGCSCQLDARSSALSPCVAAAIASTKRTGPRKPGPGSSEHDNRTRLRHAGRRCC